MSARADDVVGYTYAVDLWCPRCLIAALIAARVLSPAAEAMDPEDVLDQHAGANGLDRGDESTFDSEEFPKVVFRDQAESGDVCCRCGEPLDS